MFQTFEHAFIKNNQKWPRSASIPPHRLALCAFEHLPFPAYMTDGGHEIVALNQNFIKHFSAVKDTKTFTTIFGCTPYALNEGLHTFKEKKWNVVTTPLEENFILFIFLKDDSTSHPIPQDITIMRLTQDGHLIESNKPVSVIKNENVLQTLFPNHINVIAQIKSGTRNFALLQHLNEGGQPRHGILSRSKDHLTLYFIASSDLSRDYEDLIQHQKLRSMGELAGGIGHDFNNSLTGIIGFCDLLLMRLGREDQSYMDVIQIKQNANRAATLVRQLLAFSKQQTVQPRVFGIHQFVQVLSDDLQRTLGERIQMIMHLHDAELFIRADMKQLEECFLALAAHTKKKMKGFANGQFQIKTTLQTQPSGLISRRPLDQKQYLIIKITDTGQGIPEEDLPYIFDPFFTSNKLGKQGLGLATVYGIIQQMNGGIGVESSFEQGTTFTLALPTVDPMNEQEDVHITIKKKEQIHENLEGVGVILFVEDEDAVRMFGARALREKGYRVIEAQNGQEALNFLKSNAENNIDLIITDVVMPEMDGPTLVQHVRILSPELKVIFISGYAEDAFRQQVDQNETIIFLPKPFSLQALATVVKNVFQE